MENVKEKALKAMVVATQQIVPNFSTQDLALRLKEDLGLPSLDIVFLFENIARDLSLKIELIEFLEFRNSKGLWGLQEITFGELVEFISWILETRQKQKA